jgi:peptidoglycan DL-endopeptidase CwlO
VLLLLGGLVAISQQGLAQAATQRPARPHQSSVSQAQAGVNDAATAAGQTGKPGKPAVSAHKAHVAHKAHKARAGHAKKPASRGQTAANWALRQLGKPYRWAGAGPNAFDCSGLTMRAWQQAGVRLVHFTGSQWTSGPHVALNKLQPGDLVFYATNTKKPSTIHHVGLYIGGGRMVNAPHTGAKVRVESIYEPGLIGATRPLAVAGSAAERSCG